MEVRRMRAELFLADGRTDGQTHWRTNGLVVRKTDMSKLIVSLHDCFGKAPTRD